MATIRNSYNNKDKVVEYMDQHNLAHISHADQHHLAKIYHILELPLTTNIDELQTRVTNLWRFLSYKLEPKAAPEYRKGPAKEATVVPATVYILHIDAQDKAMQQGKATSLIANMVKKPVDIPFQPQRHSERLLMTPSKPETNVPAEVEIPQHRGPSMQQVMMLKEPVYKPLQPERRSVRFQLPLPKPVAIADPIDPSADFGSTSDQEEIGEVKPLRKPKSLDELHAQLLSREEQVHARELAVKGQEELVAAREKAVKEEADAVDRYKKELQKMQQGLNELAGRFEDRKREMDRLRETKSASHEAEVAGLRIVLTAHKTANASLHQLVTKLKDALSHENDATKKAKKQQEKLHADLNYTTAMLEQANNRIHELEEAYNELSITAAERFKLSLQQIAKDGTMEEVVEVKKKIRQAAKRVDVDEVAEALQETVDAAGEGKMIKALVMVDRVKVMLEAGLPVLDDDEEDDAEDEEQE